jgi:hypothetical protein
MVDITYGKGAYEDILASMGAGYAAIKSTADGVAKHLADASRRVPEVPEEVDDGIHAALIAEEASDGNLS